MLDENAAMVRSIRSLTGTPAPFDLDALPATPDQLFAQWLAHAVDAGVAEPLAVTLSTVDSDGAPDARVVLLKEFGRDGWGFASTRSSAKGAQLSASARAALSFWWQPQMRAIRLRGRVVEADPIESAADLAARSPEARAGVDPADWMLWRVVPDRVEFWQGATDRRHVRVHYRRTGSSWEIERPARSGS
jgi:pyridoxamine 5'-phosphate oxidase